tara:strand:- start:258 stop:389 length:132 start_codon:yes stop_codon:yes gene_type:complete
MFGLSASLDMEKTGCLGLSEVFGRHKHGVFCLWNVFDDRNMDD